MDFNFHMPVHVVSGEGAVARNSTLLRTLGRRCLIITGGSSAKRSGAFGRCDGGAGSLGDRLGGL